jgi:hypothetical protein
MSSVCHFVASVKWMCTQLSQQIEIDNQLKLRTQEVIPRCTYGGTPGLLQSWAGQVGIVSTEMLCNPRELVVRSH